MQKAFLSYTYSPCAGYEQQTTEIVGGVRTILESLGMLVTTGEDLGGNSLSPEIKMRIAACDALIAVETPHRKLADGSYAASEWVRREYAHADSLTMPRIAIVHDEVLPSTVFAETERIPLDASDRSPAFLKLIRTLALWRSKWGRSFQVELAPTELGQKFDPDQGHECRYRTMVDHTTSDWEPAQVWHEPGSAFTFLRRVPDQAKVEIRVKLGPNERWKSPLTALYGRVSLEREV